ncbi:hypothetical protein [Pseudanabaena sp. FACHB-2040]|uniref:hypothetical protein n=1 Tax=Pseudanabaena sp. FACHB-2040 TaxID=2692859 RepID=UPI001685CDB2|nr:hypothetical protein [Pseudanabaena sp. FACHB-2040]MBD2260165.1 hypothetical protein [Pseudanabaena sp. FACHB-2040]
MSNQPTPDLEKLTLSSDEVVVPKGPGFVPTFLYYFSGTALVTTFLAVKILGVGLDTGIPNQFGLLFGIVGGLVGTYFNQGKVLEIPFTSRKTFLREFQQVLDEKGYSQNPDASDDEIRVYQRPVLRQLFSGKIYVHLTEKRAFISSRAAHLRWLKKRLQ